jgi:hypothetical protein
MITHEEFDVMIQEYARQDELRESALSEFNDAGRKHCDPNKSASENFLDILGNGPASTILHTNRIQAGKPRG